MEFRLSSPVLGSDLQAHSNSGGLEDYLSELELVEVPGIYLWQRKLSPEQIHVQNPSRFMEWLEDSISKPQGVVNDSLRHIGNIKMQLGGSSLKNHKLHEIEALVKDFDSAKKVLHMIEDVDFTQTLYVGESENLASRILDHFNGRTGFSSRLAELNYTWDDVGLRFYLLPRDVSTSQRRALEHIFSIWLLAPMTSRAG
jgi:hypothetical protein